MKLARVGFGGMLCVYWHFDEGGGVRAAVVALEERKDHRRF